MVQNRDASPSFQEIKFHLSKMPVSKTGKNARKIFTQINSLPDSLKTQYFNAKRITESKLDGGCE